VACLGKLFASAIRAEVGGKGRATTKDPISRVWGDVAVAEQAASQILSLRMSAGLSPEQQERVVICVVESTCAIGHRIQVQPTSEDRR